VRVLLSAQSQRAASAADVQLLPAGDSRKQAHDSALLGPLPEPIWRSMLRGAPREREPGVWECVCGRSTAILCVGTPGFSNVISVFEENTDKERPQE
jgi:hypothetical protein